MDIRHTPKKEHSKPLPSVPGIEPWKTQTTIPTLKELPFWPQLTMPASPYYYFTIKQSPLCKGPSTQSTVNKRSCASLNSSVGRVEDGKCCVSEHPIIMFSKQYPLYHPTLKQPGTTGRIKLEPARFRVLPLTEQHLD